MNVNLNKQNNSHTYRIMQPTMKAANTIVSSQFTLKTVSYVSYICPWHCLCNMFKISILICTFYTLMSKLYTFMYKINTLIHARIKGEGGPEPFSSKFKFLNYLNYSWHCMFQRFICLKFTKNYQKYALDSPPPFNTQITLGPLLEILSCFAQVIFIRSVKFICDVWRVRREWVRETVSKIACFVTYITQNKNAVQSILSVIYH